MKTFSKETGSVPGPLVRDYRLSEGPSEGFKLSPDEPLRRDNRCASHGSENEAHPRLRLSFWILSDDFISRSQFWNKGASSRPLLIGKRGIVLNKCWRPDRWRFDRSPALARQMLMPRGSSARCHGNQRASEGRFTWRSANACVRWDPSGPPGDERRRKGRDRSAGGGGGWDRWMQCPITPRVFHHLSPS